MSEEEKEQAVLEELNVIDCSCSKLRNTSEESVAKSAGHEIMTAVKRIYEIRFGSMSVENSSSASSSEA